MLQSDIITIIEQTAPLSLMAEWDRSGVQVASPRRDIRCLAVSLDPAPEQIRAAVENCEGQKPEITDCGDFESAVRAAAAAAQEGDVVLMSPASASFDQFKNFMVRGDYFKKLVMEL